MKDEDILGYNPWGDDDSDYRVLDNRMVVTRVSHQCAICLEAIPAGVRVRAQREAYDGKAMTFRFCQPCCAAMAAWCKKGDDIPINYRTAIGMYGKRKAAEYYPEMGRVGTGGANRGE